MERFRLAPPASSPVRFLFITLLLLCTSGVFAQTGRGTLTGRVTDASGAVLQGARAELQPLGFAAVSNEQGEFSFLNVPAGSYTLNVSYVGFSVFTQNVAVKTGEAAHVDPVLKVGSKNEEVTVSTDRQFGEAEAINRERVSDNILQVLPVEIITSLPNTNIADALGRLPSVTLERDEGEGKYVQIRGTEPRLSNVTINGVDVPSPESGVRQIKLDVVPANLVDSVEINKTLSADQDAGGIGGSVNLVTKTAQRKPTFYVNGYVGYNPIEGGRNSYDIDGVVGQRFGASKKFGALFGWSYDWNGRGIDDVEPGPGVSQCDSTCDPSQSPTAPFYANYGGYDLREYRYNRSRYGVTGSLDYKLNEPLSGLYMRFIYSHFNNFGDRWVYSPSFGSAAPPASTNAQFVTSNNSDGSSGFNASIRRPVEVIGSLDFGGKHVFDRWLLTYDFAVARSASEDHGYAQANFSTLNDNPPSNPSFVNPLNHIPFTLDVSNKLAPKFQTTSGFNIFDPTLYQISDGDVSYNYSPQVNLSAAFAAQHNYSWRNHFGTFDFGFKFRNAHKFQDDADLNYIQNPNSVAGDNIQALNMSNFLGSFTNSNYYDKKYPFGPTVDYSKVQNFLNTNLSACPADPNTGTTLLVCDVPTTAQNSFPNNYDLIEQVTSGFLMNTLQFGRTRVQAGIRFEGTNENLLGNVVVFDADGNLQSINPLKRNSGYIDPLPSVQLRFDLGHDTDLRVSYGRGIARPNYSDLPPFFSVNNQAGQVGVGNPDLKPTHANNYDILVEKYLQPLGLIQGGVFFKQFSDPIYNENLPLATAEELFPFYNFNLVPNGVDTVNVPLNGGNAHLWGFEISYIQHWTFLPGLLSGLGFSGNYSYTTSTAHNVGPDRTDSPALQRQAPNSWNISPTYDKGRVSIRLGISHNDENIFAYAFQDGTPLGKTGPGGDNYLYAHTQVDAQGSFRMYRNLQVVISGLNLTNEVFGFYNGSQQYPIQREFYKPTYAFGLRYTLGGEGK